MSYEAIELVLDGNVAIVYLNRPPYNPLNGQLFRELGLLFNELEQNDDVRAVVLTGKGDRAFAAGADIKDMLNLNTREVLQFCQVSRNAFSKVESIPKPVIAAVNGLALGGGCELALACDLRILSDHAKFGLPEINIGIIPGGGATQRLQRLIGQSKAKELLYFGDMIDAQKAMDIGLANRVAPLEELMKVTLETAKKLAGKPIVAMRMMKTAVNSGGQADLQTGLDLEISCFGNAYASDDSKEGMRAFIEKRKPQFSGC
ncbi:enoyl-CoA hydratase/isomerase family protein [Paenibacillus validus]|uniref:Enoyl-CoA hydratase/isomerase family protein n=1 Tax=Paenibacillus validus TaxID=44253 RepID=A0A7X2ZA06_9BACL|nr:enoyl-CoA hydratase-related protein [Paenibacillus validus]MUG70261.1 enoyl-CoA hydratase/isomerase family protein [Paenibacillus validus]